MAIIAPIVNFSILQPLFVKTDVASTFNGIVSSEAGFRMAIGGFLLVAMLDILVAWAMYIFLKPVCAALSLLAAWIRLIYAGILIVALFYLLSALQWIHTSGNLPAMFPDQIQTQVYLSVEAFNAGWGLSLIVFGFHLLVLGFLLYLAGYMRRILGLLVVLASFGYLTDGFGRLLSVNYTANISMVTFIGEVVLIFWLLIKGCKIADPSLVAKRE